MTLTLLALFLVPFYLNFVLDPEGTHEYFDYLSTHKGARMGTAAGMLCVSLLIFSFTGLQFSLAWTSLLAWMGLLGAIKAVCILLVPGFVPFWMRFFKPSLFPMLGCLGLLFALGLLYIDLTFIP